MKRSIKVCLPECSPLLLPVVAKSISLVTHSLAEEIIKEVIFMHQVAIEVVFDINFKYVE